MWAKVDDAFPEHRKVAEAGRHLGSYGRGRVITIWLVGICYCNRNLTDGFVDEQTIRSWSLYDKKPLDVATVMALPMPNGDPGLFVREPGGYRFHDYGNYQPTASDVKTKRDWDARRKRLYAIPGLVEEIRARDRDLCRYCRVNVNWNDRRSSHGGTYDHVIPRGDNSLDNVVVCCYGCNMRKGSRTPEQAGMLLLPPPNNNGYDPEPNRNQFRPSPDSVRDLSYPNPVPIPDQSEKDHRGLRRASSQPVENGRVLKALIWREVHAAYRDPSEAFTYTDVLERVKCVAARAGLVYEADWFHQLVETAVDRVGKQHGRRVAA